MLTPPDAPVEPASGEAAGPPAESPEEAVEVVAKQPPPLGTPHREVAPTLDLSLRPEVEEFLRKEAEAEKHARENPPDPEAVRKHRERMNLRRIVWERAGGFGGRPTKFSPRVQVMLNRLDKGVPIPEDF